jgi:hypothetical protein
MFYATGAGSVFAFTASLFFASHWSNVWTEPPASLRVS